MAEAHRRPATVRLLRLRAANRCEICGVRARNVHIHHRRPRGMGGGKRVDVNMAPNLLHLCAKDHLYLVEIQRSYARRMGWLVSQWQDPAEVPVSLWDGWWLLTPDGGRVSAPDPEALSDRSGPADDG